MERERWGVQWDENDTAVLAGVLVWVVVAAIAFVAGLLG